jgi:hypothetical protein
VELIDDLECQIAEINRKLRERHAEHRYIPLLLSAPGNHVCVQTPWLVLRSLVAPR